MPLSDLVRVFDAIDGRLGGMECLEADHGLDDFLDRGVV
jgi:hypothetical protein